jgi:hypothetical protein
MLALALSAQRQARKRIILATRNALLSPSPLAALRVYPRARSRSHLLSEKRVHTVFTFSRLNPKSVPWNTTLSTAFGVIVMLFNVPSIPNPLGTLIGIAGVSVTTCGLQLIAMTALWPLRS